MNTARILFFFCLLLAISCSKDGEEMMAPAAENKALAGPSRVPTSFTQKLLVEMYSTVHCATCPDAELKYRNYAAANPDKVYGVCVHTNDAMTHSQFNYLDSLLIVNAYSSGSFNRLPFNGSAVIHKTAWTNSMVNTCLGKTAKCGLKINSNVSGSTASAVVAAGFSQAITGDCRLTVYLVEDGVTGSGSGYDQANYYNNISGSPWYQLGNPIVGYEHDFVLRKVLTSKHGDVIPASDIKAGGSFVKNFSFDITGYDPSKLSLIAFINKKGSTSVTHEVMNVQQVKLGTSKDWD